ncbi:MAG TPA: acyl-CoA desaturase [Gemmatimonadales bacterium]|nr:acyl-CoA desaturase [Gemmatimonadales bacterium]
MSDTAHPIREIHTDGPFAGAEGWWAEHELPARIVYWGIHAACLLVFVVGVSPGLLLLLAATFFVRMFGITGGYHRYFAHKSYKTGRVFQFLLAALASSATQKGPLWWAGHHRGHHKYADQPGKDVHSPADGFYYAHQGWIFDRRWDKTPTAQIREFSRYPELVWLNRWYPVPPALLALALFLIGGLPALVWGFVVSTVLLWHTTYAINSICHIWGRRVYDTPDTSRNNWLFGLLALGEGWHNNHHFYCASVRQGFRWWEIDVTYYVLKGLEKLGLVWDLREPPAHVVNSGARRDLAKAA